MDIRTLRYFLTVAREENMTTAAQLLHVTQPTLSRQIVDLEQELGRTLFVRTNRQTLLTEDGMHLRRRAEEIVSMVDRTEMEFQTTEEEVYGELHIGAGETQSMLLIAEAAESLKKRYPEIKYHIHSGNADDVSERINRGTLDFGLLFEPVNKDKYEYLKVPSEDIVGLLVRSDSEYADMASITPEELKGMPLIVSSRQALSSTSFAELLGIPEKSLNIVGSGNLIYNMAMLVQAGLGNALTISGLTVTDEPSPFRFIPLKPVVHRELVFVWKKYQLMSRAAELFLEEVKEKIK